MCVSKSLVYIYVLIFFLNKWHASFYFTPSSIDK